MKVIEDERIQRKMTYPIGEDMKNVVDTAEIFAELISKNTLANNTLNFLCRGSSGAIIAGIVVSKLTGHTCEITHIKKHGENAHCSYRVFHKDHYYIIIDDFISSGATVNSIYKEFAEHRDEESKVNMLCVSGSVDSNINFGKELDVLICGQYWMSDWLDD